jgi:hypothetical protein
MDSYRHYNNILHYLLLISIAVMTSACAPRIYFNSPDIRGRITTNGLPIENARVEILHYSDLTDVNGEYHIQGSRGFHPLYPYMLPVPGCFKEHKLTILKDDINLLNVRMHSGGPTGCNEWYPTTFDCDIKK